MIKIDFNPPANQLRQFGWISLIGFPLVGAMLHFVIGWLPLTGFWILIGIGLVMGLFAAANVLPAIKPVYVGMMLIAAPIGIVISTVLLAVIFFGMFMPVGLLFRLSGRDKLQRSPDKAAKSYWVVRETQRPPASYLRLY